MSKPWMTSEIKLLKECWHTCRDAEAAERVGRTLSACKTLANRLKKTDPMFAELLVERDGAYREMLNSDKSIRITERYKARKYGSEKLSDHCKP